MRIMSYFVLFIIILLGVGFAVLNPAPVDFNYYIAHRAFPLSLLLVTTFLLGCVLGLLIFFWLFIKLKIKTYYLGKQLKISEQEIGNLRAIPLQDRH